MRDMNNSPALFKSKLEAFLFMRAFLGAFETVNGRFTNDYLYLYLYLLVNNSWLKNIQGQQNSL